MTFSVVVTKVMAYETGWVLLIINEDGRSSFLYKLLILIMCVLKYDQGISVYFHFVMDFLGFSRLLIYNLVMHLNQ